MRGRRYRRKKIENWAVQNENVVTSRRVVFVSSGRCLESGTTAFVPVERTLVTRDHIPANGFVEEYPRSRSVRIESDSYPLRMYNAHKSVSSLRSG